MLAGPVARTAPPILGLANDVSGLRLGGAPRSDATRAKVHRVQYVVSAFRRTVTAISAGEFVDEVVAVLGID
jgi:hypothetical protein